MSLNLVLYIIALVLAAVYGIWQRASMPSVLLAVAVALIAIGLIVRPVMVVG